MIINANTGEVTWPVDQDAGPSTNLVTVRVTDDALEPRSDTATFTVVVQADPHVVINDIMYHPTVANGEYVELHNFSQSVGLPRGAWLEKRPAVAVVDCWTVADAAKGTMTIRATVANASAADVELAIDGSFRSWNGDTIDYPSVEQQAVTVAAGVALLHHYVVKDDTLRRMLPGR